MSILNLIHTNKKLNTFYNRIDSLMAKNTKENCLNPFIFFQIIRNDLIK